MDQVSELLWRTKQDPSSLPALVDALQALLQVSPACVLHATLASCSFIITKTPTHAGGARRQPHRRAR
jgi:hypothetical protein